VSAPPDAAAGSSRRVVVAAALGPVAFAPFGQVIAAGDGVGRSVNLGTADRLDHAARFESTRPEARLNLAVFRAAPQVLPFMVTLLERHPCSTQTFVPLRASRWLVCVAPARPDGAPDPAGLRAFVARGGQGIHFHRGVWHHPIVAFDEPADLVMLAWEDGSPQDCVEFPLAEPVDVVAEPSGT
jgi:ureidoglycolate lyase